MLTNMVVWIGRDKTGGAVALGMAKPIPTTGCHAGRRRKGWRITPSADPPYALPEAITPTSATMRRKALRFCALRGVRRVDEPQALSTEPAEPGTTR